MHGEMCVKRVKAQHSLTAAKQSVEEMGKLQEGQTEVSQRIFLNLHSIKSDGFKRDHAQTSPHSAQCHTLGLHFQSPRTPPALFNLPQNLQRGENTENTFPTHILQSSHRGAVRREQHKNRGSHPQARVRSREKATTAHRMADLGFSTDFPSL